MITHKTNSEKDKELRKKFITQFRNAPKPDRNIAEYLSYYTHFNTADDYITVTEAASRSMLRLWGKKLEESQKALKDNEDVKDAKNFFSYATGDKISEEGAFGCPTDLFMSGTVPLPSVELVQLEPVKNDFGKGENTMHFMGQSGRVFIFDDFKDELLRAQRGEAAKGGFAVVGYTEVFHPEIRGIHTAEYILVDPETEYTFCSDEYVVIDVNNTGIANDWGRFADKKVDVDLLIKHQHSLLMMDWYSVQIAMLHPLVK